MLICNSESTGSTSLLQASRIQWREFAQRRLRLFDDWRHRVRATDARMAARYPGLYSADLDSLDTRHEDRSKGAFRPTKKVNRQRRRSDGRDKKTIAIIKASEARARAVAAGSLVYNTTPPHPTPYDTSFPSPYSATSHPSLTTSCPRPLVSDNDDTDLFETIGDGRSLPSWSYAGNRLKLTCVARAVVGRIGGLVFSLNLSAAIEGKANLLGAEWLRKRVVRHLKAALGDRGVVLVLEATGGGKERRKASGGVAGRLHAHGFVEANPNELAAVEGALRAAGGRWENPRGSERQVLVKPFDDPDGWVRYCLEDLPHTRRVTGHSRLVSVSRSLMAPGKAVLEDLRTKISRKM